MVDIKAGRQRRSVRIQAYTVFFPAAALYGAVIVPLSVYAMTADIDWLSGLAGQGHAHEMLFGFALALVAGYLLGPVSRAHLLLLFGLWFAARGSYLVAPAGMASDILSPLFALVLAVFIVPKFLSAKKWRNRIISPLLLAICAIPTVYAFIVYFAVATIGHWLLSAMILLLALLMAFMGGRIIAPAAAGAFYRQGIDLRTRVQPRLEATLILLLAAAAITLPLPHGMVLAGTAAVAAGFVTAIRLFRWRLWRLHGRPDLLGLGIGYGWLAFGLLFVGTSLLIGREPVSSLHVITVGALGTLSIAVMTRTHLQHFKQDTAHAALLLPCMLLIAIATVTRWMAGLDLDSGTTLLWISALNWSAAYLLTALQFTVSPTSMIARADKRQVPE